MTKAQLWLVFAMGVSACATPGDQRAPAAASLDQCRLKGLDFNAFTARDKMDYLFGQHLASARKSAKDAPEDFEEKVQKGGDFTAKYVDDFLGSGVERVVDGFDAMKRTGNFLKPGGAQELVPTLNRNCDFFEKPNVKMVHALGTMAKARFVVYPELTKVSSGEKFANPWTGLFDPKQNTGGVPMLIRFSIANPVGASVKIEGETLGLEFIPGVGMKFLIERRKSVDLVAMESLAGQRKDTDRSTQDHRYFKYPFSPDFSGHAPATFNTSKDSSEILARYDLNGANRHVMSNVGEKFYQALQITTGHTPGELPKNSDKWIHPFVMSLDDLAGFEKSGHEVMGRRRPYRLVFVPALDNVPAPRRVLAESDTVYTRGKLVADFRRKLANLQSLDRIFYVVAEMEDRTQFRLGEIVLESTPFPSDFADHSFFIKHTPDRARTESRDTIVSPRR